MLTKGKNHNPIVVSLRERLRKGSWTVVRRRSSTVFRRHILLLFCKGSNIFFRFPLFPSRTWRNCDRIASAAAWDVADCFSCTNEGERIHVLKKLSHHHHSSLLIWIIPRRHLPQIVIVMPNWPHRLVQRTIDASRKMIICFCSQQAQHLSLLLLQQPSNCCCTDCHKHI